MSEFPPEPDNVRVLEHRATILDAMNKASDFKTCTYIQTIALLDVRDLIIMTIGVLGAIGNVHPDAFPFTMGAAPWESGDGAGPAQPPQATAAPAPAWGLPPGQPAFGPPMSPPNPYLAPANYPQPPTPFQNAPPVYTEEMFRQLAKYYTPEQLAALLPHVALQPPTPAAPPAAPTPDTPKGIRPLKARAPKGGRTRRAAK